MHVFSPIIVNVDSNARQWGIAKLVRHGILNPACVGSSPATPAMQITPHLRRFFLCPKTTQKEAARSFREHSSFQERRFFTKDFPSCCAFTYLPKAASTPAAFPSAACESTPINAGRCRPLPARAQVRTSRRYC